jgi:hypothetical protein
MRLVCPECKTDESLFSVEAAEIMYPISPQLTATGFECNYTDSRDRVVLDEGTVFANDIYCRAESLQLTQGKLLFASTCDACAEQVFREQGEDKRWLDFDGKPNCPEGDAHKVAV